MQKQTILQAGDHYAELDRYIEAYGAGGVFLVCGPSASRLRIGEHLCTLESRTGIPVTTFRDFTPNPCFGSVLEGAERFRESGCDLLVALGGGSAMDVAKCIRVQAGVPARFLAVPTTAGSGSEATRFAVIYRDGRKCSVEDERCLPDAVLFDPSTLETLPEYQRKATMLDALCHALESFWSVNSTAESQMYSEGALRAILASKEGYLNNTPAGNAGMLRAANLAGRAINIARTTAGHALCYKLTTLFGIAHGHAAALCVAVLWPWMLEHLDRCVDGRGQPYLADVFSRLAACIGVQSPAKAAEWFRSLLDDCSLKAPLTAAPPWDELVSSVNGERLKNNPVVLRPEDVRALYRSILS